MDRAQLAQKRICLAFLLNDELLCKQSGLYYHYPHNFYTQILANYVLLCLRSWIEHNLRKKGFVQISYLTTKFWATKQVYVAIITRNYYAQILANYVLLCLRSWIEHNLCKKVFVQISHLTANFCATNQVYVTIIPHNYYAQILANYVLLCL